MTATLVIFIVLSFVVQEAGAEEFKKQETGLYRDVFDENIYYEGTNLLHLDRLYRKLFRKKLQAGNVNWFDEVPDSAFFTNRHARKRLSASELASGYRENSGPDLGGDLVITRGKFEGLNPDFFVRDARGEEYLLKFDPVDNFELGTAAENIAGRFYYAMGYPVPQNDIIVFDSEKLKLAPEAEVVDDTGFKKKFTQERLQEYLVFIPQNDQGKYRATAGKLLPGQRLGSFYYEGRRKEDPEDLIPHTERRELRALQVFSAWLNNFDVRASNTVDTLVDENGKKVLRHYLVDFNSALGAARAGAKPPMVTHEYLMDYGESLKAFLSLGLWEKPWQKRWREAGESVHPSPAIGYFDNRYFDPAKFKIQLPHYAFKDLTRADGFWAAKILMSFTDEDIRAVVHTGEFSRPEDEAYIEKILTERRDILGRYGFGRANPLDFFDLSQGNLVFKDLAVEHGFAKQEGTLYQMDVLAADGKKRKSLTSLQSSSPSVSLENLLAGHPHMDLFIRTLRQGGKPSPYVLVEIRAGQVAGVVHED